MLRSTINRGFQMTFENGLTISVQFGNGNYCNNRDYSKTFGEELNQEVTECENAEIAIWDEKNNWFRFESDTVKGWVNADDVAEWIIRTKEAIALDDLGKYVQYSVEEEE